MFGFRRHLIIGRTETSDPHCICQPVEATQQVTCASCPHRQFDSAPADCVFRRIGPFILYLTALIRSTQRIVRA